MDRVNQIWRHLVYQEHYKKIQELPHSVYKFIIRLRVNGSSAVIPLNIFWMLHG